MGFKIINSREYREVCERVAFLESDIDSKNRELEIKEENIKRLKKEIVQLQNHIDKTEAMSRHADELRDSALKEVDALRNEVERLKMHAVAKKEVINFEPEEPASKAEDKPVVTAKPKRGRSRVKKDNK